ADRETRLAVASAGVVAHILVHEGDVVVANTPLVGIESSAEQAALKVAEADGAAARAALDRALHGLRPEAGDVPSADKEPARAGADLSATLLTRTETLVKGGAATAEELDRARQSAAADRASLDAADARHRAAKAGSRYEDVAAARATLEAAQAR